MAKVAKKGYFLNPVVREWLERKGVSQKNFCSRVGKLGSVETLSDSYFSSVLTQRAHAGINIRPGILRELSKLFGREVEFDEVFSTEEYAVEGKGKLWE